MQEKDTFIGARSALLSDKLIKNLQARGFEAYYCGTSAEAVEKALSLISQDDSVSWGGSVTLEDTGLLGRVKQGGYTVIDRDTATSPEERAELMRQALTCGTYLTSFNAMSEDGVLFNVDCNGNRVAASDFGPRRVIALVGMNKVCKTAQGAMERARSYAAPINVQRFSLQSTACAKTGSCGNCTSPECICSYIVETRMCKTPGRIKVILIGETQGF